MTGRIRWYSSVPSTGEFLYDISEREFDTSKKSMRDTIVELLLGDWECFGENGDIIQIVSDEVDNDEV